MDGLDERKMKILDAIIRTYLETGEPVGSRTISKYTDLNLSSATIRNEMSDLEELGYIVQPHKMCIRDRSGAGGLFDPCRNTMVKSVNVGFDGTLVLNMTAEDELAAENQTVTATVLVLSLIHI